MTFSYCPQCGHERVTGLRFCTQCRLDFESLQPIPSTGVTSLMRQAQVPTPARAPIASSDSPGTGQANQLLPVLAGVAWLIGAAAIGYLAFLQLEYSGMGFADSGDALGLAVWNGATAAITAYFGAMAIVAPTRSRLGGAVVWAALNVAWGGYQVSQGLTHAVFMLALVAFSLAGVLALVAWSQLRQQRPKAV